VRLFTLAIQKTTGNKQWSFHQFKCNTALPGNVYQLLISNVCNLQIGLEAAV